MHMALRAPAGQPVIVDGRDVSGDVAAERSKCAAFAEKIRAGALRGATGKPFTDVVNIGIGGSDLGPAMVTRALSPYAHKRIRSHFVSNVDGADMADTLSRLDPATTLFIVSSKTFTTQETMMNAHSARRWIAERLGEGAVPAHFAAVSTNITATGAFGIGADRVFRFWDWVGGRYSVWSAIGLPVMIAIGARNFEAFLAGAHQMDSHFRTRPLARNMPVVMALVGIWYRNVMGYPSHAVLPYDQRLARFPAYLQQLDMESNGKGVRHDGRHGRACKRALSIFGEPGTNGQHAFFQLIHQGTDDRSRHRFSWSAPNRSAADAASSRSALVANCLAQTEALMKRPHFAPRSTAQLAAEQQGLAPNDEMAALAPHKVFLGQPADHDDSSIAASIRRTSRASLIALYEHKVFVQSASSGASIRSTNGESNSARSFATGSRRSSPTGRPRRTASTARQPD
jgi:glucose-6-phosphate isomerase